MAIKWTLHFEAPVEKVFDLFKDPSNFRPPRGRFTEVNVTKEGMGTNYVWTYDIVGPIRLESFSVFTEFVPNRQITERSSSAWQGTWTYRFEPEGTGTKLTLEGHPASVFKFPLIERLLGWGMARNHDAVMAEFKAGLERKAAA